MSSLCSSTGSKIKKPGKKYNCQLLERSEAHAISFCPVRVSALASAKRFGEARTAEQVKHLQNFFCIFEV